MGRIRCRVIFPPLSYERSKKKTSRSLTQGTTSTRLDMFHTLHCLVCTCTSHCHSHLSEKTTLQEINNPNPIRTSISLKQDNIRKALHPEYYGPAHNNDTNFHLHQNHCIEQLRQYIMCSGDMTPIPTRYYTALGRNYVDSDVPHTCRNFEKLQKWMVRRYEGVEAVKAQLRPGGKLREGDGR